MRGFAIQLRANKMAESTNSFSARKTKDDSLDMTSMVDVSFLLVIFFMVTASFTLESAFETPQRSESSTGTQDQPSEKIEVSVDQFDHFIVLIDGTEVATADNKYELKVSLKSVINKEISHALISASPDAKHEKVVEALDVLVGLRLTVKVQMKI